MQRKLLKLALAAIAAAAASSALGDIKWTDSYNSALASAKSSNKIVMIEFYTDWDVSGKDSSGDPLPNWSGRLEKETLSDGMVQAVVQKMIPVRLNAEKEGKEIAAKFHIRYYPTILFVDQNQNDVGTIDGMESPDEFVKHAETFLKDAAARPALEAKYKSDPQDLDAIAGLGVIEADRYHISSALTDLAHAEALDHSNGAGKLSDLYNAIGDYYQNASQFGQAIQYFKKTGDTSKDTDKKAYALLSIATCYMTMDVVPDGGPPSEALRLKLIDHLKLARPLLEATLKLPNLKDEDRKIAENDLKSINQALGGGD